MKNKELKKEMLLNGKYNILKKYDKKLFKEYGIGIKEYLKGETEEEKIKNMSSLIEEITIENNIEISIREIKTYIQINNNKRQKSCRLKNHINYYVRNKYKLVFATFTFNEETIKKDKIYRKETITRMLNKNENIIDYIGNVDYGKENGREHYHYIIILKKDFEPKTKISTIKSKKVRKFNEVINMDINYKLGFTTYELIGKEKEDTEKVKNYITKLTLHAIKQEKRNQIIKKRNSPYHDYQKRMDNYKKERKEAKIERKEQRRITKIKKIEEEYQMSFDQIKRLS